MSKPVKTTEDLVAEVKPEARVLTPVEEPDEIEPYAHATPVDTMWVPSPKSVA